jgi:nicotinate-nucleotide adenylyltransferase
MAELAVREFGLDEVRFIPCRISPHKQGSAPASSEDRLAMLRLAMADVPWAVIDDLELKRNGASYSYETAELMKSRFPTAKLFWIMGGDQWEALPRWKHPERLARCVEFIVISRGGKVVPREYFLMHIITNEHPASATEVREAVGCGGESHQWLSPAVARYIQEHGLYRGSSDHP